MQDARNLVVFGIARGVRIYDLFAKSAAGSGVRPLWDEENPIPTDMMRSTHNAGINLPEPAEDP